MRTGSDIEPLGVAFMVGQSSKFVLFIFQQVMCGSIEVDVWRARIGLFAARIASRLPKGCRKVKKQVLFAHNMFAGGGGAPCSFGCDSNYSRRNLRETRLVAVLMSLLLATSVMNVTLLLKCGDVETNPGPGRYSGMPNFCTGK